MHKIIFSVCTLFAAVSLTSCVSTYYQVYDVEGVGLKNESNSLVYDHDDCRILYNLWSNDGNIGFIFQNKTDQDIYVDKTKTFFIVEGAANDYFRNREYTEGSQTSMSLGYSVSAAYISNGLFWPYVYNVPVIEKASTKATVATSSALTIHESEYVCIPAKSWKLIGEYKISPKRTVKCDRKSDFPSKTYTVGQYDEESSPLHFKNRIAYSFDKDSKDIKHVENLFWVKSIVNYSEKSAVETYKEKYCYSSMEYKAKRFKIGGPNKFYQYYSNK